MKRSIIFLVIFVMLGATMAFAGHGQWGQRGAKGPRGDIGPGGPGGDFPRMGMILWMADEIGLDEKQQAKIGLLMEKNGAVRIDKQAELEKAQLKMKQLRLSEASDNEVLAMMDKIGLLKTELHKMRYLHRQEVKSILSEEQLDKIKELRRDRRGNRFDRGGFGPGSGHPPVSGRGAGMRGGYGR
jgi:Spy/CpxP family protein refolding chaperone